MQKLLFTLFTIILLLTGCSCADSEFLVDEETIDGQEDAAFLASSDVECNVQEQETQDSGTIFVYVCGEVSNPGVYELDSDSRVINAVTAAGGILETADDTYVNLAAPLEDGIKLKIPSKEEIQEQTEDNNANAGATEKAVISKGLVDDAASSHDKNGMVNINTASLEELTALPGIGESIAGKVIRYREENGSFSCVEDIMKINGIKNKLFEKIKDRITV